ncbi:MAG: Ig-like domain-containing protein, partial [Planctomycetota bacterium]
MLDLCLDGAQRAGGRSLVSGTLWIGLGSALLFGACGGGGGGGGDFQGPPGTEFDKPGGGTYFLDPHRGGAAARMHLAEVLWGRLADVHALLTDGSVDPEPEHRDLLIKESVQSDGLDYRLEVNPISQRTRLVVQRVRGAPDEGSGTFEALVARAKENLLPVLPRDESSSTGVASLVPRNGTLALRFDDLLSDDDEQAEALIDLVRLQTGYPPSTPLNARLLFDPNHGGIAQGEFHSTRVLVDFAITAEEAADSPYELAVNALGLPASLPADSRANVSLRLPTRLDPSAGIFRLLTNLVGAPLDRRDDGPYDPLRGELVRAFRSGRGDDGNNGFVLDLNKPALIGAWPITIDAAFPDPSGPPGRQWVLDLQFETPCRRALAEGDVLSVGAFLLEPVEPSLEPDSEGRLVSARLRLLNEEPLSNGGALLGGGLFQTTFSVSSLVPTGCWISLSPPAGSPPTDDVAPESQIVLRFSEPMDPGSVDPFGTLRLARGRGNDPVRPSTIVVANAIGSPDLRTFRLSPLLPLAFDASGEYNLALLSTAEGVTDLGGNGLAGGPAPIPIHVDPAAQRFTNGGVVLRFDAVDELEPIGKDDLRGQIFYDLARGVIRGRSPSFEGFPADQSNPVPSIMIPFLPGVQTPLSGLGSKMQAVWRYCDLGWFVEDESKHNLDVVGLNWSPAGGTVLSDFFERFELRLAHSRRLPDEARTFTGTFFPCSGLGAGARICTPCATFVPYEDNILVDPRS